VRQAHPCEAGSGCVLVSPDKGKGKENPAKVEATTVHDPNECYGWGLVLCTDCIATRDKRAVYCSRACGVRDRRRHHDVVHSSAAKNLNAAGAGVSADAGAGASTSLDQNASVKQQASAEQEASPDQKSGSGQQSGSEKEACTELVVNLEPKTGSEQEAGIKQEAGSEQNSAQEVSSEQKVGLEPHTALEQNTSPEQNTSSEPTSVDPTSTDPTSSKQNTSSDISCAGGKDSFVSLADALRQAFSRKHPGVELGGME